MAEVRAIKPMPDRLTAYNAHVDRVGKLTEIVALHMRGMHSSLCFAEIEGRPGERFACTCGEARYAEANDLIAAIREHDAQSEDGSATAESGLSTDTDRKAD